ncbi:hypothetical protein GCM10028820_14100 [Tessaracoccus terricola]
MVGIFAIVAIAFAVIVAARLLVKYSIANPAGWFLLISVAFLNLGYLLFYHRDGWRDGTPASEGLLVTSLGLFVATSVAFLGHLVMNQGLRVWKAGTRRTPSSRLAAPAEIEEEVGGDASGPTFRIAILCVCVLGPAWIYFALLGSIPLFQAVRDVASGGLEGLGSLQAARLARDPYVTAGASYIPLQGLWETFRNFGAPLVFAYALLQRLVNGRSRATDVAMVAAIVTSLAAGQRWPLMYVLLAGIVALGQAGKEVPRKLVFRFVWVGVAAGAVLSALQARSQEDVSSFVSAVWFGFLNLIERIVLGQVEVPAASYGPAGEVFRGMGGYSYWVSFQAYLPGSGASFPVEFHRVITGQSRGFTASPDLYTEAYLNFGLVAAMIIPAVLMMGLVVLHYVPAVSLEGRAIKVALITVFAFMSYRSPIAQASIIFPVIAAAAAFWVSRPRKAPRERKSTRTREASVTLMRS